MIDEGYRHKWQSSAYSDHYAPDDLAAYAGEMAVCRSAGTLHAEGGPCPIVAVYRPDLRLGALLHVDGADAEMDGNNHEQLIDHLVAEDASVWQDAVCHVFLDEVPMAAIQSEEDAAEQANQRRAYGARIEAYLKAAGLKNVQVVYDGEGKTVELDTVKGVLSSKDDADTVTFIRSYGEAVDAQEGKALGEVVG